MGFRRHGKATKKFHIIERGGDVSLTSGEGKEELPLVLHEATLRIGASARLRLSRWARVSRSRSFCRYSGSFLCSRRARVFRVRSASRYSGSARLNLCSSLRLSRLRCRDNAFCSSDNRGGAIHRCSRRRRSRRRRLRQHERSSSSFFSSFSSPPPLPLPSTRTYIHTQPDV